MRRGPTLAAGFLLISSPVLAKPCAFNSSDLSFDGTPVEQAQCLLRPVAKWGRLGEPVALLPPTLASLLGTTPSIPSDKLAALAKESGLPASSLAGPVSRARGGGAKAPKARYFVIHDTSSPWLGDKEFPQDIDSSVSRFPVSGDMLPWNVTAVR